jgi:hypothetical protein
LKSLLQLLGQQLTLVSFAAVPAMLKRIIEKVSVVVGEE